MKQRYFIKFDPRINQLTGCQRTTLILSTLEYWFSKKPDGFYKFIEPCPHPLYKKEDSWTEELNCDAKSFTNSFKKIGVKYRSRTAFEKAEDKFQGKMYASFYDRYSNRVFFIRNNEAVNKFFATIYHPIKSKESQVENKEKSQLNPVSNSLKNLLRNGKNSQSYKEPKNSSPDLSKDKSHTEKIIKKMIEFWTAIVEEGGGQIELTGKRIAFLKKAFIDKFDCCLEKWKKFCQDIASSRFLMGEIKSSFRATLDWALKFEIIQKIFDGNYGIGDRTPKTILLGQVDLQEEIFTSEETQETKDFRTLCLQTVGNASYISYFKNIGIEFRGEGEVALMAPHKFGADSLERNYYSYLRVILQGLGKNIRKISILAPGETSGRLIELERGKSKLISPIISTVECSLQEELSMEETVSKDEPMIPISEASLETQALREKLRNTIALQQFPSWLSDIEVESIDQAGAIVVAFEDELKVDYCRVRFNQQILSCAQELWNNIKCLVIQKKSEDLKDFEPKLFQGVLQGTQIFSDCKSIKDDAEFLLDMTEPKGKSLVSEGESLSEVSFESLRRDVNRVLVHHKLDDTPCSSIEKPSKNSETIPETTEENSMLEQALQSLLSACSSIKPIGLFGTEKSCPDFC